MKKLKVSYSSLEDFKICPYRYYLKKCEGIVPEVTSPALTFGKAIHAALAEYNWSGNLEKAMLELEAIVDTPESGFRTKEFARYVIMMYVTQYHANANVLHPESHFEIDMGNFIYNGYIDGLGLDANGKMALIEYKTTSVLTSRFISQFTTSWQITGYLAAMQKIGIEIEDAQVILLHFSKTKGGGFPKVDFESVPSYRREYEIRQWYDAVSWVVDQIYACIYANKWIRLNESCVEGTIRAPFQCQYYNICYFGLSPQEALQHGYKIDAETLFFNSLTNY